MADEKDVFFIQVKTSLRLSIQNDSIDSEINDMIYAARIDLETGNVSHERAQSDDKLILQAVVAYVKGNWGFDNAEAPRFLDNYERLKIKLGNSGMYNGGDTDAV